MPGERWSLFRTDNGGWCIVITCAYGRTRNYLSIASFREQYGSDAEKMARLDRLCRERGIA